MSLTTNPNSLPVLPDPAVLPFPAQTVALLGTRAALHELLLQSLLIRAARGERLALLVGDNRLDAYRLARLARGNHLNPAALLGQIHLTRAFTCYQLQHAIVTFAAGDAANPRVPRVPRAQPRPLPARIIGAYAETWDALYISGLLDLFYDQDLPADRAERLLRAALARLRYIAAHDHIPVLITAAPSPAPDREAFIEIVKQTVDAYWQWT